MLPGAPTVLLSLPNASTSTATVLAQASPSTLVGPTGTAPGAHFVQPDQPPVLDSSNTGTFSWPLGFAMLFLAAVMAVVVARSLRNRSSSHPSPHP